MTPPRKRKNKFILAELLLLIIGLFIIIYLDYYRKFDMLSNEIIKRIISTSAILLIIAVTFLAVHLYGNKIKLTNQKKAQYLGIGLFIFIPLSFSIFTFWQAIVISPLQGPDSENPYRLLTLLHIMFTIILIVIFIIYYLRCKVNKSTPKTIRNIEGLKDVIVSFIQLRFTLKYFQNNRLTKILINTFLMLYYGAFAYLTSSYLAYWLITPTKSSYTITEAHNVRDYMSGHSSRGWYIYCQVSTSAGQSFSFFKACPSCVYPGNTIDISHGLFDYNDRLKNTFTCPIPQNQTDPAN